MQERLLQVKEVSIHAPREGCDTSEQAEFVKEQLFQFTHPGRGATVLSVPVLY